MNDELRQMLDDYEHRLNEQNQIILNLQSRITLHEKKIVNLENRYSELRREQLEAKRRSDYNSLIEGHE